MSEQKYINNKNENLEPAWRDRLLLESLVGQILPTLIIAEPEKVDEILEFLKDESLTLSDFFKRFPEYKDLEIKDSLAIEKHFAPSADENQDDFFPLVNFNHSLLYYLTEIIKDKNILTLQPDDNYKYQLRVSLYNNFNRYLNRLLMNIEPHEAETLCLALVNVSDYKTFLQLLAKGLKVGESDIINNFFNPINKK